MVASLKQTLFYSLRVFAHVMNWHVQVVWLGERGGIKINDYCQTSDENIYAIGECALWDNKIYGLVAPGYDMARIAAKHI
jgi:pyruvate/2-oxoglutarate dehydrogenase complex dihydrolipoamide dehydrogenase (E3) component